MRYRIKIVTYANGRKTHTAQKRLALKWCWLDYAGKTEWVVFFENDETREEALQRIDKNIQGNTKKHTIEFEYINKP